jgi:DNA polymerase type B, organellar and viral
MRPPWSTRTISRNHACQRPSHFLFVDVETIPFTIERETTYQEHHIRLGCVCSVAWPQKRKPKETWHTFKTAAQFWTVLEKCLVARRVLWVFAHNALFDLTILRLWNEIEAGRVKLERPGRPYRDPETGEDRMSDDWRGTIAIDGLPFWIESEVNGKRADFIDSMNYYACSLADMGRSCGVPKLDMPEFAADDATWERYCRNDVEVLKTGMLSLLDEWGRDNRGNWQPTAASLAWSHYRHKHMPEVGIVVPEHAEARHLEWSSYFGGECRAFYRGSCGPVTHYDVNSLYPSVMHGHVYPRELVDFILCPNPGIFDHLLGRYCVIGDVTLRTDVDHYPLRLNDRVIFPIGEFRTVLAGAELHDAWVAGRVHKLHAVAYYRGAKLFDSYVDQWYTEKYMARREGNTTREKLAKLMLNALPGKFVQRSPQWEADKRVEVVRPWQVFPFKDSETGIVYPARSVAWLGQVARVKRDCQHTFPAVGAFVTSYARVRMRRLRARVPKGCCLYQDTDSLMIHLAGVAGFESSGVQLGEGLGQLRTVGEYSQLTIRGPKNYTADGVHRVAGVKCKDRHIGDMRWVGERFERSGMVVTRPPDGTIRSWHRDFETPGTVAEGGYDAGGWYYPRIVP